MPGVGEAQSHLETAEKTYPVAAEIVAEREAEVAGQTGPDE